MKVIELENTIIEMKDSVERFISQLDEAEERIHELKTGQWNSSNHKTRNKKESRHRKELTEHHQIDQYTF